MITLKRDNVVKQTESEVVALALESQGFVREGAAKKAAPENEAPAAEKELKEELAAARSQNAALKQELDGAKDQLEVALKENATLKQELDGTKDQLEVALKQNQETAEKSQTARRDCMASEQENRIVAEVMDNMKMAETEESSARRYVRRAVDKILIYCCREDLPGRLEGTAAQIAEDMLKADLLVSTGKETSSVTRGDTTISYRDPSASRSATVDFMKNYETSLNHYKKMRLPKDNHAGS